MRKSRLVYRWDRISLALGVSAVCIVLIAWAWSLVPDEAPAPVLPTCTEQIVVAGMPCLP